MHKHILQEGCSHCTHGSRPHHYVLDETENFRIACDPHPLEEGHILIIPKSHIPCIGAYEPDLILEFKRLYKQVSDFVQIQYGSVAVFEHGVLGQTVFHSHVHFLPFTGNLEDIIPEGTAHCTSLTDISELKTLYERDGGYLYCEIRGELWTVDTALAEARFFRDRFGKSIGHPERANWKEMSANEETMKVVGLENKAVQEKWRIVHQ